MVELLGLPPGFHCSPPSTPKSTTYSVRHNKQCDELEEIIVKKVLSGLMISSTHSLAENQYNTIQHK